MNRNFNLFNYASFLEVKSTFASFFEEGVFIGTQKDPSFLDLGGQILIGLGLLILTHLPFIKLSPNGHVLIGLRSTQLPFCKIVPDGHFFGSHLSFTNISSGLHFFLTMHLPFCC